MAKDFVIVKGKVVRMNDAAFKIASRYFKATKNRPEEKIVPVELLKMPKLLIQPRIQPEVKVVEAVKAPVIESPVIETPVIKEPELVNQVKKAPVKVTRRKK